MKTPNDGMWWGEITAMGVGTQMQACSWAFISMPSIHGWLVLLKAHREMWQKEEVSKDLTLQSTLCFPVVSDLEQTMWPLFSLVSSCANWYWMTKSSFLFCFLKNIYSPSDPPWLIHVNVWQKPLHYCKVISLQLIKINEKKKRNCQK